MSAALDWPAAPAGRDRLSLAFGRAAPRTLGDHLTLFGSIPSRLDLLGEVEAAGLLGRGGAAFPVAPKLAAVLTAGGRPVVVANGTEGEPASGKDRTLLRLAPHLVIDGAAIAARFLGAREAIIAVADTATDELTALRRALAERRGADGVQLTAVSVPDRFVTGEETALLRALAGRPAKPTVKPPFPAERGLSGRPTLVQNVETLAHVALIARYGSGWFRTIGHADAPGTALVTLTGAVARPGIYEVALGTPLADVVSRAGGATEPVAAYLIGGYFGRWITAEAATKTALLPELLGAGAIVAFPEGVCAVDEIARVARYLAGEGAGQCGPCVHGLPAIAGALEEAARGGGDARASIARWAGQVTGRGACRHPDGAARFAVTGMTAFASELEQHARRGSCGRLRRRILPLPEQHSR